MVERDCVCGFRSCSQPLLIELEQSLVGDEFPPDLQDILLGFEHDEAVAAVATEPVELCVRIAAHPTKSLVDDIETGNDLTNVLKPGMVGDIRRPESLDTGLAKDCPLAAKFKEHVHGG